MARKRKKIIKCNKYSAKYNQNAIFRMKMLQIAGCQNVQNSSTIIPIIFVHTVGEHKTDNMLLARDFGRQAWRKYY